MTLIRLSLIGEKNSMSSEATGVEYHFIFVEMYNTVSRMINCFPPLPESLAFCKTILSLTTFVLYISDVYTEFHDLKAKGKTVTSRTSKTGS
jgi:hypothetical protein